MNFGILQFNIVTTLMFHVTNDKFSIEGKNIYEYILYIEKLPVLNWFKIKKGSFLSKLANSQWLVTVIVLWLFLMVPWVVCDCGISCSYSLTFLILIETRNKFWTILQFYLPTDKFRAIKRFG